MISLTKDASFEQLTAKSTASSDKDGTTDQFGKKVYTSSILAFWTVICQAHMVKCLLASFFDVNKIFVGYTFRY